MKTKNYSIPAMRKARKERKQSMQDPKKYVVNESKSEFLLWIAKKEKYNKIEFNESELIILQSLERIKKVYRSGMNRIYQFIGLKNKSFYLTIDRDSNLKMYKNYVNAEEI